LNYYLEDKRDELVETESKQCFVQSAVKKIEKGQKFATIAGLC
jgi:hypothetical protein